MKQFVLMMTVAALMSSQNVLAQNRVKNLYTEAQTLKVEQVVNTEQTVQVNRYLFAGYNTLCLPMSLDANQLESAAAGVKVERLAAIRQDGNVLSLLFVDCTTEGIEAGVPYLIYSPKAQYLRAKNTEANGFDTEVKTIRMTDGNGNQVAFGSSWNLRTKDGLYGIPAKQDKAILESVLTRTNGEQSFLPTRCGFSWEQQSATAGKLEIKHVSMGEVTAIRTAISDEQGDGSVYDLNGRRVNGNGKGLYIQNGKKVVR